MRNKKYKTVLHVLSVNIKKKNKFIEFLKAILFIAFIIYVCFSIIAVSICYGIIVDKLLSIADILLVALSIIITIVALSISASYDRQLLKLLNNIKEANETLKLNLKTEKTEDSIVLNIFIGINLAILGGLFIAITVFQIINLIGNMQNCYQNVIKILNICLSAFLLLLNCLSIGGCIKSSKQYKIKISDIESINTQLFEWYNKLIVDKGLK